MKTLYISDLDGTLLTPNATLSNGTIVTMNKLLAEGLEFTCATARTPASVSYILSPLDIKVPAIMMNGVIIYNLANKRYEKVEYLEEKYFETILNYMRDLNLKAFIYGIHNNILSTYYESISNDAMNTFMMERVTRYHKVFTQVDSFDQITRKDVIYCLFLDKKNVLDPLYDLVKDMDDISCSYYKDVYFDDIYCLELFSKNATKYNGVKYIKETYGYDKIVAFGDNLNDIPMFQASDDCYAMSNAKPELKALANDIIGSNKEDGVAAYLEYLWTLNKL